MNLRNLDQYTEICELHASINHDNKDNLVSNGQLPSCNTNQKCMFAHKTLFPQGVELIGLGSGFN